MRHLMDSRIKYTTRLRREWSSHNLIGNRHLEMMVAVNADNHLVALLPEAISGGNMNFLPNLATWAFHRHDNILFGFHRRPVRILLSDTLFIPDSVRCVH